MNNLRQKFGTKVSLLNYHCLVCKTIIKWIASFLSDSSNAIRVDGFLSELHSINSTVPRGSVNPPVLVILFINELLSSTSSSIYSFADDTYLSLSNPQNRSNSTVSSHRNSSASSLTNDMSTIEKWGNYNRVQFNQGKTTRVVISRKHHQEFPLYSSVAMSRTFHLLSLSLVFQCHLIFLGKPTSIPLLKHASQKLGFLSRARGFFSPSRLLTIYKSQIRSSMECGSHVWDGAPRSSLHRLDKVQSKAIRLIIYPSLTKSLQSLSRCRLVADLSSF